jgi:hypothetical protein
MEIKSKLFLGNIELKEGSIYSLQVKSPKLKRKLDDCYEYELKGRFMHTKGNNLMFDTSCLYYASKEEILIRDIISIEEETE